MSEQDTARARRDRLKDLRANISTAAEGTEQEPGQEYSRPGRRGAGQGAGEGRRFAGRAAGGGRRLAGRAAGGGRRQGGDDFRARILNSLREVDADDELIEGTDVGQKNLEELVEKLDAAEGSGPGSKLAQIVWDMLDPVEIDGELEFSPEGVTKLITFLEQDRGQRPRGAGRQANGPRGRGGPRGGGRFGAR